MMCKVCQLYCFLKLKFYFLFLIMAVIYDHEHLDGYHVCGVSDVKTNFDAGC